MGDEDDGEAEFAAQADDLLEDEALHDDVDGGGGFVHDDEVGLAGQGQGDGGALAHAAGHFVWVGAGAFAGDADHGEQVAGALVGGGFAEGAVVGAQDVGELVADAHERVEGVHGALQDDRQGGPAVAAQPAFAQGDEVDGFAVAGVVDDAAGGGDRGWALQPGQGGDEGGFAGAGFAGDAEDLAA